MYPNSTRVSQVSTILLRGPRSKARKGGGCSYPGFVTDEYKVGKLPRGLGIWKQVWIRAQQWFRHSQRRAHGGGRVTRINLPIEDSGRSPPDGRADKLGSGGRKEGNQCLGLFGKYPMIPGPRGRSGAGGGLHPLHPQGPQRVTNGRKMRDKCVWDCISRPGCHWLMVEKPFLFTALSSSSNVNGD